MAVDPELAAETRAWMLKAAHDLRAAETLAATLPALNDEAVFHCQQAAEKAIKGFLAWHGQTSGHRSVLARAVPLSEYAWKFRYPGVPADPDSAETAEALAAAREVVADIAGRLPAEVIG
jgi:hypothetical protein